MGIPAVDISSMQVVAPYLDPDAPDTAQRWVVHAVVAPLLLALGSIPFFIIRAVFSHSAH